ncbi:hypothetical protein EV715DRAFT_244987 [Schizophyllum commune]
MRRITRAAFSLPSTARSFASAAGKSGEAGSSKAPARQNETSMARNIRRKYKKKPRIIEDERQARSLYGASMRLVDRSLENHKRKPIPRDPHDEAERLKTMLATAGGRAPSLDKMEFDQAAKEQLTFAAEDNEMSEERISLGSFLELRGYGTSTMHAVALRNMPINNQAGFEVFTSTGELWKVTTDNILYHIPQFVPLDVIARCGTEYTAQNNHELAARTKILLKLREMDRDIEERRAQFTHPPEAVHERFRHLDDNQWSTVSPQEVAEAFAVKNREPTTIDILAAHKYMYEHNLYFVRQFNFMSEASYDVRPKAHVDLLSTVLSWARPKPGEKDQRHILEAFAEKAAEVVQKQEQLTAETRDEPLKRVPAEHHWTPNELIILRTLLNAVDVTRENSAYDALMWYVLGKVFPREKRVSDETLMETIRALGVLSPSFNPALLAPSLRLPLNPEAREAAVQKDNALVERAVKHAPVQTPLGPEDFHAIDPLEAVRHDWGDMPVYVVDDVGAHELDDGISVERDGEDVWVHVHVADPASVLPPGHVFAKRAAERIETLYLSDRNYPLLPTSLVQHPVIGPSLAGNRGRPDRVLTFSSKIDADGNLKDYAVRAGLAGNVKKMTYDAVDAALGLPRNLPAFPFGAPSTLPPIPSTNMDATDLENFKTLHAVAKRCIQRRCDEGIFLNKEYKASPWRIDPGTDKDIYFEPGAFRGAQRVELAVRDVKQETSGARGIIAEAMKLAGRAASLYGLHNDLPLIRRSASAPIPRTDADLEALLDLRDDEGFVEWHEVMGRLEMPSSGSFTLQPSAHFTLGVPEGEGYVRVTSPLRRHADLLAHYNIHHRLSGAEGPVPFDAQTLDEYMHTLRRKTRFKRRIEASENSFWSTMFIKRFVEDARLGKADGSLLRNLDAYVNMNFGLDGRVMEFRLDCYVPQLGLRLRAFKDDQALAEIPVGQRVQLAATGASLGIPSYVYGQVDKY